jgi:hypothetical protein
MMPMLRKSFNGTFFSAISSASSFAYLMLFIIAEFLA